MPNAYQLHHHHFDAIVIGAGGAGLRAACEARKLGLNVAVLSKVPPTRSHTVAAQGGINAALGNVTPDDWRWHMYDTVRGSDWLGDQDAIAFMCKQAPAAIVELEHMGMPFTRQEDGRIYQRAYGGQASHYGQGPIAYRACAVADRTGHSLLHTLYAEATRLEVKFFIEWMALDLIIDQHGRCAGVLAWELSTGDLHVFRARATIIATGGYGQAYAFTTSSSICTGDGNAMALRAGLPLQDMEFIQFHPTGLYGTGILITEGARGEGGFLINADGARFMERYAPKYRDLASRDVIARAMIREIRKGRGCGPGKDHLLLKLSHLDESVLRDKLPGISEITKTFLNIDIKQSAIPVVPSVHYTMGGIPTNANCDVVGSMIGSKDQPIPGLIAIGEAASNSVHGANRLGCNALLDLVVFGKQAGRQAAAFAGTSLPVIKDSDLDRPLAHFDRLRMSKGDTPAAHLRKAMQQTMTECAGIYRDNNLLRTGLERLAQLWHAHRSELLVRDNGLIWNNDLIDAIECDNLLRQSIVSVASAIARTESRGAHFRDDYPERDDRHWLSHSLAWMDEEGRLRLDKRPVRMNPAGIDAISPEPRSY